MDIAFSGTELKEGESIAPLVEAARRHGAGWLELWYPENFAAEGVDTTLERLASASLQVATVATGTKLGSPGDPSSHQRTLIEALELADRIGCGLVATYFGHRSKRDDEAAINAYVENVAPCVERAEALGVTLSLENEFDGFGNDPAGSDPTRRPEAAAWLLERVGSPRFRMTFDPCNAYFAGAEPFPRFYEAVRPHITYVHVKDGSLLVEAADPGWTEFADSDRRYVTRPLGEGALNWPGLLKRLTRDGYDGFLTLEPHARTDHRDAAWDQAAQTLKQWLNGLRTEPGR